MMSQDQADKLVEDVEVLKQVVVSLDRRRQELESRFVWAAFALFGIVMVALWIISSSLDKISQTQIGLGV